MPPSGVKIPVDRPRERSRQKRGRGVVFVALALVVVLLAVVGGALAWPHISSRLSPQAGSTSQNAPTLSGPTPTVVANYKLFANNSAHYTLNYPQQWTPKSQNNSLAGQYDYLDTFTQTGTATQVIVEQAQGFGPVSNDAIIHAELVGGQQTGLTFTEIPSAAGNVTIGGEQFMRREYSVTGKNLTLHMAILAGHYAGRGYALVLVSSAASYTQNQPTFQIILGAFRFTS